MVNAIGSKPAFGNVTRQQLNKPLNLNNNATVASSTIGASRFDEYGEPRRRNNTGWWVLGGAALLTAATVIAGKTKALGQISEPLQKHYETAEKYVVDGAKSVYNTVKGWFGKKAVSTTEAVKSKETPSVRDVRRMQQDWPDPPNS